MLKLRLFKMIKNAIKPSQIMYFSISSRSVFIKLITSLKWKKKSLELIIFSDLLIGVLFGTAGSMINS